MIRFVRKNKTLKSCNEVVRKFFANTSIRGFSRIVKSESPVLRSLWILFVISTITFLVVSIFKVVIDYRQYSVNIQTYIQIDNATPFPAVTFCNHQPFSEKAYQLWEKKLVMSPTKFNQRLRTAAMKQFQNILVGNMSASDPNFHHPLFLTTINDRISVYYQNLPTKVTSELGHNISIIKNCIWSYAQNMAFDNHCMDDMLIVKTFSHPLYFNCYTVEPSPDYASMISRLGLIIWLGPDEQTNIKHRQGFLLDIFEQAYGLRVVIHEPGSFPNIESQGVQIEPGRLNELNYQPELNVKVDTERKPCINNPETKYKDLGNEFKYDIDLCFNMALQEILVNRCKCIFGYYPRYLYPDDNLPYCGYLDPEKYDDFSKRKDCVTQIFNEAADIKSHLKSEKKCIHRCTSLEYATTTSVTKWRPTDWQMYWLKEILDAWGKFQVAYDDITIRNQSIYNNSLSEEQKTQFTNLTLRIQEFLTKTNLSDNIPESEKLTFNERYTFVVVKRKANNTFIKEERLVLSFNALVSRVGGLCSLYIGLTFAFFIEILDFLYTLLFLRKKSKSKDDCEKLNPIENQKNCKLVYIKNETDNEERSQSETNNNPPDVENNSLFQGTIYWNLSSKTTSQELRDNKKYFDEDNHNRSHSILNLSNPWIPIDENKQ